MAFDSSKTSGKLFRVALALILAVALIPVTALFDTQTRVSALENEAAPEVHTGELIQEALPEDSEGSVLSDSGLEAPLIQGGESAGPEGPGEQTVAFSGSADADEDALLSESDGGDSLADELVEEDFVVAEGQPSGEGEAVHKDPTLPSGVDTLGEEVNEADDEGAELEVLSRIVFSVEGDGLVEILRENGEVLVLHDGEDVPVEQVEGSFVVLRGNSGQGRSLDALVGAVDALTQVKIGEDVRFEGASFEKDITFSAVDKLVKISFVEAPTEEEMIAEPLDLMRSLSFRSARGGDPSQPEVGDSFSGKAVVRARNIVSAGGRVADITVDPTSGILSELSSLTTYCAHHSAAAPLVGFTYSYTFTVTSVDKDTGEVRGSFYATSDTLPTDGVSRDARGRLTGYQGLEGEAVLWRTYARGGISISKSLEGGSLSELEGIAFEIFDSSGKKMQFPLPDGSVVSQLVLDENGRAQTAANALLTGTYSVVEVDSSVPANIIPYAQAQGEGSNVVASVNIANHGALYPVEVVNYKMPELGLIKVDGDSLAEAEDSGADPLRVSGSLWALERKDGSSWLEIERHVTDEEGCIQFSDQAISEWGNYRLVELESAQANLPEGYMSLADSTGSNYVEFVVDASTWSKAEQGVFEGEAGDSWEFSFVDGVPALVHTASNWRYREIEVVKLDEQTGEPLSQTAYSLWRYLGEGEPAEAGREVGEHAVYQVDPSHELDPGMWELVAEGETDDQGSLIFRGLPFGFYLVVEEIPNPAYAEWWESSDSTWGSYCIELGEAEQKQVQVFENMKITVETTVGKSTIAKTSAAFRSLPGQNVSFDNVGFEEYRYDVVFSNGETNVRADQYTVVDQCDFTDLGMRLTKLWTPVVVGDSDGSFNLWFRTSMTDQQTMHSPASATATNPENRRADGSDRISTLGWRLWSENVVADARTQLDVSDLGLVEGEYVTGLLLEYGSVEVGFGTSDPLTYLVIATEQLMDDEVIHNSVSSHITRNWRLEVTQDGEGYDGLYDDAYDQVQTTVLETMSYEPSESTWVGSVAILSQTGDGVGLLAVVFGCVAVFGVAGAAYALRRRRVLADASRVWPE